MSALESSIAAHLRTERKIPARKDERFTPPYPSFSARFPTSVVQVTMAYFGAQHPADADFSTRERARAELDRLVEELGGANGAGDIDRARYTDEASYETTLVIAYWSDPAVYDRWRHARTAWTDSSRRTEGLGYFTEVLTPSVDRFETLFSNDRVEGVSALADALSGEVREHGYWGGSRDRMPLAQIDALEPEGALHAVASSEVRVRPQHNLCLIRSGQDWSDTRDNERAMYLDEVEPVLREGMDFLRDAGIDIGCYANRYMTVLDATWRPVDKTFGMSWWHSMAELDAWAESHPTHVAIFRAAMRHLRAMAGAAKLRLYHEITVASVDQQEFVYLDCHPSTGLLRAVSAAGVVS